jgi:cytochrome c peroxidase
MGITKLPSDSLKFRVPSLRNVMVTGPYGHDGRFFSVGAVIEHYRTGTRPGPTLDPLLRNGLSISLNEKSDLVQFLGTLTDTAYLRNPRYAEPR